MAETSGPARVTDAGRAPSAAPGVEVRDLVVRRGSRPHPVLDGVSLRLTGGVVSLVGPNGAGKSTLLRVLATLNSAQEGSVAVAGCDLGDRRGRAGARRRLGFLPQEPTFPGRFTAAEAITYAAWLHRVPPRRRAAAVRGTLAELDLLDVADVRLDMLSGGTRRRAHIGQALVHEPVVLLLDEPTVGLDAEHRVDLRRVVRRLGDGRLVLLSTHFTEDVELLADRVVVLAGGRVRFDGSPGGLPGLAPDAGPDERVVERALRRLTEGETL